MFFNYKKISFNVQIYIIFLFLIILYNLYLTYLYYDSSNFFIGDGLTYKELSDKLFYEFKYYENFPAEYPFRAWRTPGYPFFLFVLKFFKIESANQLFILNQIFLISTYFLFLKLTFLINKNNEIINIILILILYVCHINTLFQYYIHNHNEPFYIFLITAGVYLIILSINKKKELLLIIGLLILSYSCLVRTPTLLLTTASLTILFILSIFKIINFSYKKILFYFLIFYIFPLIWIIRNYYILDYFPFFLGSQSTHLLLGTYRYIDWIYHDTFAFDRINEFKDKFEVIRPSLIKEAAMIRIFDNPLYYINTRIMNILKYLINNQSFFSLTILLILFLRKINLVKKFKNFLKIDNNFLIIFGLLISILFIVEMSITFHVPRYGVIPSMFFMFFSNLLIIKILEFKK